MCDLYDFMFLSTFVPLFVTFWQGRPEQIRKNSFAYLWPTKISKKRAFSAYSEILKMGPLLKEIWSKMSRKVICVPLPVELRACLLSGTL